MNGVPVQEPVPASKKFLPLLAAFLIGLILYTLFWLNYFGVYKITGIFNPTPSLSPQKQASLYQKQIDQLDSITTSINIISASFNPKISQEQFGQDKKGIESEIQRVKDMLAAGDVEGARKIIRRSDPITSAISGLLNSITSLGDPLQSKFVPQELKQKHDPRDKYIQKERVDPEVREIYLSVIDILVSIDN
jgi:hypothetical protein